MSVTVPPVRTAVPDADPPGRPGAAGPHSTTAMPVAQRAARVRFRRALSLTAMTLVLPGSAQLVAGNRRVGRWAIRISAALVVVAVGMLATAAVWHELAFWAVTTPSFLRWVSVALIVLGLCWAALFVDAWRLAAPLTLSMRHRRVTLAATLVGALAVGSVLVYSAHLANVQRGLVLSLFAGTSKSSAVDGRYNILLLGGDSGTTRWGLRTDSINVASIDEDTGRTVIIGIPRNLQNFPFERGSIMARQFPHGYRCDGCEINSLTTWANGHTSLFKGYADPGVEATEEAVEGVTGLKINYWAEINLQGFRDLADAVGGVTINVRQPIAIGKTGDVLGYIQPGVRKLSGDQLLWYARSRATSDDYSRMARQKCVINAFKDQIGPSDIVKHFTALAKASTGLLRTSIPPSEVDTFIKLGLKAKSQPLGTVSLVPPAINTYTPNIAKIKKMVRTAIAPPASGKKAKGHHHKKAAPPSSMTEGSYGSMATGYLANNTSNLGASC
jgi:polyisoprenyl-teichoic acid--peptidoglycan teichoic acid transferase